MVVFLPGPLLRGWGRLTPPPLTVVPAPRLVQGTIDGLNPSGSVGPPLAGVLLEAARYPCPGYDECNPLDAVTTATNGSWSFWVPPGEYLLFSNGTGVYGGVSEELTVAGPVAAPVVAPVRLLAYPRIAYENATFVLPDWNSLSEYAANCNQALPCPSVRAASGSGAQVPLTSWTQDGVFYVNSSLTLVFDSFANRTVRAIAPWVPLHDDLMSYDGVEDTEWITGDGTYVYEFGCLVSCTNGSAVTLYAVNVSTGRTFEGNLSGVAAGLFYRNAQMDLVGIDGNLSTASVVDENGTDFGYDLWTGAQWKLGTLPYFEANNLYWVAPLDSYFDVQAGGSRANSLTQWRLVGLPPSSSLELVASTTFATGFLCNGVEGLVFNATAGTLAFTAENVTGSGITDVYWVNPSGILAGLSRSWDDFNASGGSYPDTAAFPNVESSEHRPSLLSNGPAFAGFWSGWYANRSWLVDPATGAWSDASVSLDHPGPTLGPAGAGLLSPAALEGLFLNTTYALVPWSYDCRDTGGACAILGNTAPSVAPGTVWWTWRSGAPEFPFPADAAIAQTAPPSDPTRLGFQVQGENVTILWDPPSEGADPLLNYTLFYATGSGPEEAVSVPPQATSVTVYGLLPDALYDFRLEAWNLHWHSAGAVGSVTTGFTQYGARSRLPGGSVADALPGGGAAHPSAEAGPTASGPTPGRIPARWPLRMDPGAGVANRCGLRGRLDDARGHPRDRPPSHLQRVRAAQQVGIRGHSGRAR